MSDPASAMQRWEQRIEAALDPGRYVSDRGCFAFVSDLEEVAADLARLVATDPESAVILYETLVAGCTEKANEVDDSSGALGSFVVALIQGWVTARPAAGARPDRTASRLLAWVDDDPFGFCHELVQDVAEVLDQAGRAALIGAVRARFEAALPASTTDEPDRALTYRRRRSADALRALYAADADVDAYVHLVEQLGLTPADCHTVATMLVRLGRLEQALSWVERGLALNSGSATGSSVWFDLTRLKPRLLADLGRTEDAMAIVWVDFCARPDRFSFDELMAFVPDGERLTWQEKAITTAVDSAGLRSLVDLLVHTQQPERLADLIAGTADSELEALSHYVAAPAAALLDHAHPLEAARLCRAQGIRILTSRKSQYYDAALDHFARAKRGYARADRIEDWKDTVVQVQTQHRRKSSFMPHFQALARNGDADDAEPKEAPSFLDRAKARWTLRNPD